MRQHSSRSGHVRLLAGVLALLGSSVVWAGAPAAGLPPPATLAPAERRALMDAIRPLAAQRTAQAVKIKVERLNVDADWALLTGELVSGTGGPLAWERARECHRELDKMLWVVLAKKTGRWQVQHLEVCATEPPHWTPEQFGGLTWPCGVYAGLQGPAGEDLQAACRQAPAGSAPHR